MKKQRKITKCLFIAALLLLTGFYQIAHAADFPQWRGPNRDGKSTETDLSKKWPGNGPELLWSIESIGKGYSSPSISKNMIYTTGMKDGKGILRAYDLSGNLKWETTYGTEWDGSYAGARSTPTVDGDRLYVISGTGKVVCLNTMDGQIKWEVDMPEKFGSRSLRWGLAESPLIVDDKLICTPGGEDIAVAALDKMTGKTIWTTTGLDEKSAYCSPILIQTPKRRLIVTMLQKSIVAIDPEDGSLTMRIPHKVQYDISAVSPLYSKGSLYVTNGYNEKGIMYQISDEGTAYEQKWTDETLNCHHGGVVLVDGFIYGSNNKGKWVCVNWDTGKVMYKTDGIGKGSVIYADGRLYCYEEKNGTVALVKASPSGYEITGSFNTPKGADEYWAHPVPANGRLYIRHGDALMVYDIKSQTTPTIGWRNDSTGNYPEATVVSEWSDEKNIIFKTPLPGVSNASPIIINDKIFFCSEPDTLICADAKNGNILWQKENHYFDTLSPKEAVKAREILKKSEKQQAQLKELGQELDKVKEKMAADPNDVTVVKEMKDREIAVEALKDVIKKLAAYSVPNAHETNGYSSPTPTTDGKYVYTIFGTGVAVCYDMDGNRIWSKFIETPTSGWGHSASPLLIDDKLIIHVKNLVALNSKTGQILWKIESEPRWGSPIHAKIGNVDVVVTPGGDIVRAQDGEILAGKVSSLEYAAPISVDNKIYFIESGGKALQLPDKAAEQINPTVLWQTTPKKDRYYASSIVHDGLIYAVTKSNVFSVIDAGTGQIIYDKEIDLGKGTVYPSIVLAGNHLFVSNDNGTTLVLQSGREYIEIAKNKIEGFRSTPLLQGSRMYVRSLSYLYCIGN